jgi:hypothetical protein
MVIAKLYGRYLYHAVLGDSTQMKWTANKIRCILVTSSYTPNQDTHEFYSQITAANELTTANGYTVAGVDVTSQYASYSTNNVITLDCSDAVWANSTITARYAVLYDQSSGANSASQVLIGYIDFEADQSSSSGTFTVQWSTAGVVAITVA